MSGVASGVGRLARRCAMPLLDLADAGQVLVELALVGGAEPSACSGFGVLGDEVEDALACSGRAWPGLRPSPSASPPPKSRSKTSRGLISLAIGVVSARQEMFDE